MMVCVPMRTGHVPDLSHPTLRVHIREMAIRKMIPMDPAVCRGCEAVAPLYDWWLLGTMSLETQRAAVIQAAREGSIVLYLYLLGCRGTKNIRQPTLAGGRHG
jgi:hypothetical protein